MTTFTLKMCENSLKEILLFFKRCKKLTSNVPFIREQVYQINQQGLEFHACLQQSIAQSNKLESHAESVMSYIEVLKEPIFDTNRILNVLTNLLENTQSNMEESQRIKDKY